MKWLGYKKCSNYTLKFDLKFNIYIILICKERLINENTQNSQIL